MSLHRNKKRIGKTSWYNWSSFANSDTSNQCMITVGNKINFLPGTFERYTPYKEYEIFVTAHGEGAAECIPTKPKATCRVLWESVAVKRKQNNMKTSLLNKRNPATLLFIDFCKEFHSIPRWKMQQILFAYNLPIETVTAIMNRNKNKTAVVRSPDSDTDFFEIITGILQGDTLVS